MGYSLRSLKCALNRIYLHGRNYFNVSKDIQFGLVVMSVIVQEDLLGGRLLFRLLEKTCGGE